MARLIDITGKAIPGEWGDDDLTGEGIPVLRTTNFTNDGVVNYANVVMRDLSKKDVSKKYLRPGDIIIEKSGGSDNQPVGRVIYFDGPKSTYLFNNFTGVLRVSDPHMWIPRYIFYALFANYQFGGTRRFENRTTGLHNLQTDAYVASVEIKEFPVEAQQRIVNILDKLSNLISLRKQQLAKLDELVKAQFVEMFGDPGINPHGFTKCLIGEISQELFAGGDKPSDISSFRTESYPYPVYANGEANLGLQGYSTCYRVNRSALTISARGTLGFCCIREAFFTPVVRLITLIPKEEADLIYLKYAIESADIKASGTSQGQLTIPDFKKTEIMLPPIEYQRRFSSFAEQTDKQKLKIQQSLDKLEVLKKSLMQEYFG